MPPFCIPQVVGVPGHESTNMDWWTPSPLPSLTNFPEDPNWLGAFSLVDGQGTTDHVQFRALNGFVTRVDVDGEFIWHYLFLSWVVHVQPNAPQLNKDGINLLIGDGTNFIAVKMRLASAAGGQIDVNNATAFSLQTYNFAGGTLTLHATVPTWATDTARAWVGYNSPIDTRLPTPVIPWAFQIRVPLDVNLAPAGQPPVTLSSGASFKMWYQVQATITDKDGAIAVAVYPWSGTASTTSNINIIPAGLTPPDVALPGVAGGCAGGVTLDRGAIAIEDVTTGATRGTFQLDLTGVPPDVSLPQHQNVFYARPNVSSLSAAQQATLRARFRLANWGTQFTVPTPNSWKIVPGGEAVTYQGPAGVFTNSEFRFTWPKPPLDAFTTALITGIKLYSTSGGVSGQAPHQCMLVEMTSTDPTVIFAKSSEFNNLWGVNASVFRTKAVVSFDDPSEAGSQLHDVYLYLKTNAMPKVVDDRYRKLMAPWFERQGNFTNLEGRAAFQLRDVMDYAPSYEVHSYYDTGKLMDFEDGSKLKILRPMTSFGYVVGHEGPLVGWETRLYGAKQQLTDVLYLVPVRNHGEVRVTTALQGRSSANEPPLPATEGGGCLIQLAEQFEKLGPVGRIVGAFLRGIARAQG